MNTLPPPFSPSKTLRGHLLFLQKCLGWLTALLLMAGFASLVDGLTAEMMRGPNRVDALPGTETHLSGPIPVKKAELADFLVRGNTPDGQVRLEVDNFFPSYWFGSGMWRGRLVVGDHPDFGEYPMVVEFRDAPAKSAQIYRMVIWADAESMRHGSFSRLTRDAGLNPFHTAAVILPLGLVAGFVTFLTGQCWQRRLHAHGYGEIYKVLRAKDGAKEATFSLGQSQGLSVGRVCQVLRPDGSEATRGVVALCEARYASLLLPAETDVRPGYVVLPLPPLEAERPQCQEEGSECI